MALVNQYQANNGGMNRQGNANYVLYALAKKAAAGVFNDVTKGNSVLPTGGVGVGTNSVPCQGGTPNCSVAVASQTGLLVKPGSPTTEAWMAGAGYDLATGLGSANVNNLASQWKTVNTTKTTTTLTLSPTTNITHGKNEKVTVNISVMPTSATGSVSLIAKFTDGTRKSSERHDQQLAGRHVQRDGALRRGRYERPERFCGGKRDGGARKQQDIYRGAVVRCEWQHAEWKRDLRAVWVELHHSNVRDGQQRRAEHHWTSEPNLRNGKCPDMPKRDGRID
jgi:hypothetical protein